MLRSLTRDSGTKSDFAVKVLFSIINQKCYTYRNVHNPIDLVYEKLTCIYYLFIYLFFFRGGGGGGGLFDCTDKLDAYKHGWP